MSTLATLNVVLNGDIGGFLKSMKQAEDQSSSSSNMIQSALSGIGSVAKVAAAGAVATIGAVTGATIAGVAAYNNWAGQLDSIGDVLGTTADQSAGLAVAIRGVGGDVDALTGQMAKFGKSATENGKTLNPVQQQLKTLGVTLYEVGKTSKVTGTALPSGDIKKLSDNLTMATAKLHDMQAAYAKAKSPTETASLNLAKQRDLVASLTSKLDAGGKTITRTIGSNGPLKDSATILEEVATKISKMPDGLEKTKIMMELFGKSGKDMSDTLNAIANGGLSAATEKAKKLGLAIGDDGVNRSIEFGKSMEDLKMTAEGFAVSIGSTVMPLIQPLIKQFADWAVNVMPQVRAGLEAVFGWIQTNVGPIVEGMVLGLQTAVAWVQTNWPMIQTTITTTWNNIRTTVEPAINAIAGFIRQVFGSIAIFLQTHGEDIKGFIGNTWNTIRSIVEPVIQWFYQFVTDTFGKLTIFIQQNQGEIQRIFQGVWDGIKMFVGTVLEIIRGIVNVVLSLLRGDVQGALDAIKTMFVNIWNGIKDYVGQAVETMRMILAIVWFKIREAVENAWNGIKQGIETAWDNITKFFSTLPAKLFEAGKAIMEGLWEGIKSMFASIGDGISNFFQNTINDIKSKLGIQSPSTVFAGMGTNLMLGLAQGIARSAQVPRAQLAAALDDLSSTVTIQAQADLSTSTRPAARNGMSADMAAAGPTIINHNYINDSLSARLLLEQQRNDLLSTAKASF
jgi:hypothetical protein